MKLLLGAALLCVLPAGAQTPASACAGAALGPNGALNGFVPSPSDAWHTDIASAPVDPLSATILTTNPNDLMGAFLHPDFGTSSGIPYNVVDSTQTPSVPATLTLYPGDSDRTLAPLPANAPVEGNPGSCPTDNNDRHMIVFDRNKCVVYEYDQAGFCNGGWSADNMALWDLTTAEHRPYGMTSADAAGLSIFEGLIRYDEIVAGQINHAIRFTASHTKQNANNGLFVAPASHASGNVWGTDNIIGMRLRLKANFDISGFSATNQIILKAMKQYGMILADNGSSMFFQGTTDPRWDDADLAALHAVQASDFEVLPMGPAYDASTAPTGAVPTINSFTASAASVTAGTPVTLSVDVSGASYSYVDQAGFVRDGTVTVTPAATTTYTLFARNAFGSSTATLTVTVSAPPSGAPAPTALRLQFVPAGAPGVYTVRALTNSPAPVSLQVRRGPGKLAGTTLTVSGAGDVTLEATQPAVPGCTAALALGTLSNKAK